MDLTKLSKKELLDKCEELGIKRCKSKTKNILIDLINKTIKRLKTVSDTVFDRMDTVFASDYKNISSQLNVNVIDLFCGCGGMSKGLSDSGLNIIAGIDVWTKQ